MQIDRWGRGYHPAAPDGTDMLNYDIYGDCDYSRPSLNACAPFISRKFREFANNGRHSNWTPGRISDGLFESNIAVERHDWYRDKGSLEWWMWLSCLEPAICECGAATPWLAYVVAKPESAPRSPMFQTRLANHTIINSIGLESLLTSSCPNCRGGSYQAFLSCPDAVSILRTANPDAIILGQRVCHCMKCRGG
jgi:hypothetical protein